MILLVTGDGIRSGWKANSDNKALKKFLKLSHYWNELKIRGRVQLLVNGGAILIGRWYNYKLVKLYKKTTWRLRRAVKIRHKLEGSSPEEKGKAWLRTAYFLSLLSWGRTPVWLCSSAQTWEACSLVSWENVDRVQDHSSQNGAVHCNILKYLSIQ